MVTFTDEEIVELVAEEKVLLDGYESQLVLSDKRSGRQASLGVRGATGREFCIKLRQSTRDALDFSAILVHVPRGTNREFRLRRYNGKTGQHTNSIEHETLDSFHIHLATERYQEAGHKEDAYAEETNRYSALSGALECLLDDCGFVRPNDAQLRMFSDER